MHDSIDFGRFCERRDARIGDDHGEWKITQSNAHNHNQEETSHPHVPTPVPLNPSRPGVDSIHFFPAPAAWHWAKKPKFYLSRPVNLTGLDVVSYLF